MIELSDDIRRQAEQILEHRFANSALLAEALTHASVAGHRLRSNERLEFLGDAILGAVVCEHLFRAFPECLEGELTKIKSSVVSRRLCAEVANRLGLTDLLSLGKGMTGRHKLPASLAAAAYESVVAAIYLDAGMGAARDFILRHMEPFIQEAADSAHQHNFKSVLQQHAQKHLDHMPSYVLLQARGPDHAKNFQVRVEMGDQQFPPGWGASKKQAEQKAALLALAGLGVVDIDENGQVHMADEMDPPPADTDAHA